MEWVGEPVTVILDKLFIGCKDQAIYVSDHFWEAVEDYCLTICRYTDYPPEKNNRGFKSPDIQWKNMILRKTSGPTFEELPPLWKYL